MAVADKDLALAEDGSMQRLTRQAGVPIRVTPAVDNANALDAGDVAFDMTAITNAVDNAGGVGVIEKISIYDKGDNTAAAFTLVFGQASTSIGTIDSAPSISDANAVGDAAAKGLDVVAIASGDWVDLGGLKIATLRDVKLPLKAASGSRDLYVGGICGGTPTYATGDIVIDVWMA